MPRPPQPALHRPARGEEPSAPGPPPLGAERAQAWLNRMRRLIICDISSGAVKERAKGVKDVQVEKVAIILFVKDEADEIVWWIAWHLRIGIDTIIIYDDYSTDGTWEIINAASCIGDVRCFRASDGLHFQHRQGATYMRALDTYRSEFEWMGFLDADEYLDLRLHQNVHDFLGDYSDANAVAINWCCYGSNNHIIKPGPNVFEHYTRHSTEAYKENNYVKSFVRPSKTRSHYLNTHNYAVEGRYVLPDNSEISWEEPHRQRSTRTADWTRALIRHYVIRSVEHYVEKVKRRSDIRTRGFTMQFFLHYDCNDVREKVNDVRLKSVFDTVYALQHYVSVDLLVRSVASIDGKNHQMAMTSLSPRCYQTFTLRSIWGTILSIDTRTGLLCHAFSENSEQPYIKPAVVFKILGYDNYIYVTSPNHDVVLRTLRDDRISTVLAFQVSSLVASDKALRNPLTAKFVAFPPLPQQGLAQPVYVEVDRDWASEWERVKLEQLSDGKFSESLSITAAYLQNYHRTKELPTISQPHVDAVADAFTAHLSTLPSDAFQRWRVDHNIVDIPWLRRSERISL